MTLSTWLSLLGICLLGAMAPGPSLAVVLRATLHSGRRGGLAAALAHSLAVGGYALLTASGLALAVQRSPGLFSGLQLAGAVWLLYLGISGFRHRAPAVIATLTPDAKPRSIARAASDGFLIAFLNPKIALFMLALFSQFLPPTPTAASHAALVGTIVATDGGWYCLVALLVSRQSSLERLQRHAQLIDRLLSMTLVLLGSAMLLRLAWPLMAA